MKRSRVALVLLMSSLLLSACGYGAVSAQRDRAEAVWSDVQGQYQRRADMVSALVGAIHGAALQTPIDLSALIQARAAVARSAATPEVLTDADAFRRYELAQSDLSQALANVLIAAQDRPQLQGNPTFLTLQAQIDGPTTRLAVARRDYNEAASAYNRALHDFPTTIWARTVHAGSEPLPLLDAATAPSNDGRADAEIASQ